MTQADSSLTVSEAGIIRRLRKWGSDAAAVVVVKAGQRDADAVVVVRDAVAAANQALVRDGEPLVWAQTVFLSARGPMFDLYRDGSDSDVRAWLEVLRGILAGRGWLGTVLVATESWYPEVAWRFRDWHSPWAGFIAMSRTQRTTYTYGGQWLVSDEGTAELTGYARQWVAGLSGTCYFSGGTSQAKIGLQPPPAELLGAAVRRSGQSGVSMLALKPLTERRVQLHAGSCVEFQSKGVQEDWRESIANVREGLLALGHAADYAVIHHGIGFWEQSAGRARGLRDLCWRENRHLWSSYVPDAYGIQVLTRSHVARANDLADWSVSPLGGDRYLVEARDLDPWFSAAEPDAGAWARARDDFGAILLTDEAIRADPYGWLPGDPARGLVLPDPD